MVINWRTTLNSAGVSSLPSFEEYLPEQGFFSLNAFDSIYSLQDLILDFNSFSITERNRTYVNTRSLITGSDYGFVEIRNPQLLPESHLLHMPYSSIESYLEKINISKSPVYISYYYYRGLNLPRRFHHDTRKDSFKIFIALSDIDQLSHGPYIYVRRSHRQKRYILSDFISRSNILKTGGDGFDAAWIDNHDMYYGFMPRTGAFISNQRGIHGDLPAQNDCTKIVMAICFNDI